MMTKQQVYVHIKNYEIATKAQEVLEKHNEHHLDISEYAQYPFLKFDVDNNNWTTSDYHNGVIAEISVATLDKLLTYHNYKPKVIPELTFNKDKEVNQKNIRPVEKSILQEAQEIVNGSRAEDYGSVTENFTKIANGWKEIFADGNFTPRRVAMAMIWLKICRDVNTPKRDNLVDCVGYVACVEKMENEVNNKAN